MVNKDEFLNENYDNFREELDEIIDNYQSGQYRTTMVETKIRIENLLALTGGNPKEYLEMCSLQKILGDIYNIDYVKKISEWANEHGFTLCDPVEMKDDFEMDTFAIYNMRKKSRGYFNVNDLFTMTFVKERPFPEGGSISFTVTVPILEKNNEEYNVKELRYILSGINRMEADLP